MSWETELLEASGDLTITHEEVQEIMSGLVAGALRSFLVLGIMTLGIKEFYNITGKKKLSEERKEVLVMAEEIW